MKHNGIIVVLPGAVIVMVHLESYRTYAFALKQLLTAYLLIIPFDHAVIFSHNLLISNFMNGTKKVKT